VITLNDRSNNYISQEDNEKRKKHTSRCEEITGQGNQFPHLKLRGKVLSSKFSEKIFCQRDFK
jgi:hypothetical protein